MSGAVSPPDFRSSPCKAEPGHSHQDLPEHYLTWGVFNPGTIKFLLELRVASLTTHH